jgi:exodeoxyribonuclease VII small subunit
MKGELTYDKAYQRLEQIVEEIESDSTQVDTLAEKIKEAKTLVSLCERKLKDIEVKIEDAKNPTQKKK